ncbi:hypothetical protein B0H19DRAFT_1271736 [Mycena capillaripes]|nr:hypothetical protein B0H19DRAFT_1271736 [Mycena capillaripes]
MSASSLKSSNFANMDLGTCSELGFDAILLLISQALQAHHVIQASRVIKPVHHQTAPDPFASSTHRQIANPAYVPGVEAEVVHGLPSHRCSRQPSGSQDSFS